MAIRTTDLLLPPTGVFTAKILLQPPSRVTIGTPPTDGMPNCAPMLNTPILTRAHSRMAVDVGTAYDDFKAVEECLENLKKEHHHPLRVYNSQSAEDYNRKRVNAKNPKPPVDCQKIRHTYYSVRCVHYGEPRLSRGSGIRPNQRSFAKGCQAKVTLSYDR